MATYTPYTLPNSAGAATSLRNLQLKGVNKYSGLMDQDPTAERRRFEDALYTSSARGVNEAADRDRQAMLETTFGAGTGSSSRTMELAGKLNQVRADALAQAARDAYTGAGNEWRANTSALQDLYGSGFNMGTTGLQAEANVGLTNAGRALQAQQGNEQMALQNRGLDIQQQSLAQALSLAQQQMAQQESQFGRSLTAQEQQAALNRAFQETQAANQMGWMGGQSQATRDFTAEQQAFNRALQAAQFDAAAKQQGEQFYANLGRIPNPNDQRTFGGITSGLEGLMKFFGPTVGGTSDATNNWLSGLIGVRPSNPGG